MKTVGWILLIIGLLSFLGAAAYGDSVAGPSFFIALGLYYIHRAHEKKEKKSEENN